MEASRQMYRVLMEEVVRFLERCHYSLDAMLVSEPMSRSKSTHYVHQACDTQLSNTSNESASDPGSFKYNLLAENGLLNRGRCSTIDGPTLVTRHLSSSVKVVQSADSYSNFRDFTWLVLFVNKKVIVSNFNMYKIMKIQRFIFINIYTRTL